MLGCEQHLTEAVVAEYLRPLGVGAVRRYELPRIRAFNFVIEHALAGGASRSLRLDTQGKALGVALLELSVPGRRIAAGEARHERQPTVRHAGRSRAGRGPDAEPPRAAQRAGARR